MDCIFNELSLEETIADKSHVIELMQGLIESCQEINKLCKKPMKLRVVDDFRQKELLENYTIQHWLQDKIIDMEHRRLLHRLLDSPTINETLIRTDDYINNTFEYNDGDIQKKSDSLGVAVITGKQGALALSLNSHSRWDKDEIELYCYTANEKQAINVKHASKKEHIEKNKTFILIIKSGIFDIPTLTNPFPNLAQSNKLKNNNWSDFMEQLYTNRENKLSVIQDVADSVAKINGYALNSQLSSLNQKKKESLRKIYQANEGSNTVYLSIDFEKGAFELCNHKGKHQGEYLFSGEKNQEADKTGNHNIMLSL